LRNWLTKNKKILLLGFVLFYLYFRGTGDHGLIDPVEGVNASVSLHMFAGGNYFVPRIGDSLTAGRSIGTWWLYALALKIFGWGEFAVRFWSALSGLLMILAAGLSGGCDLGLSSGYYYGDYDYEEFELKHEYPRRSAWLSAYICAGMTGCFVVSQIASSHALFACLTSFAMMSIMRSRVNKNWLIGAHFASVLAFIAHGPESLILTWLAVIVYASLCEDWALLRDFFTWPAGIITAIIMIGMYLLLMVTFNPNILHFMRCQNHVYSFGGFAGIMTAAFMSFVPYHGFLLRAIWEVLPDNYPAERSPELFMLIWALIFAVGAFASGDVMSIAATLPALSAILGRRLDVWLKQKKLSSINIAVVMNILILVPALYVLLPFSLRLYPMFRASLMSLIPWGLMTGLFIYAAWYYTRTKQIEKWVRNVPAAALLCLMPLAGIFNLTSNVYSIRDVGLKLRDIIQGSDKVIQYGVNYPSVYFYTLRNSELIGTALTPGVDDWQFTTDDDRLHALWDMKERIFLIIPENMTPKKPLPKNIFHITKAQGMLLLSNQ